MTGTEAVVPASISPPTITGTPAVGQELTVAHGQWSENPMSYGYSDGLQRCSADAITSCSPIFDVTPTYTVTPADVGLRISAYERAVNAVGPAMLPARTVATAVVAPAPPGPPLATAVVTPAPPGPGPVAPASAVVPDPLVPALPGRAGVGRVRVEGQNLAVPISCTGTTSCTVSLTLSAVKNLARRTVIALSTVGRRVSGHARLVELGRRTVRLSGGQTATTRLALNATGQGTLARRRTLRAMLFARQNGAVRARCPSPSDSARKVIRP